MGFNWIIKTQFSKSEFSLPGSGGRPTGRPDQEPVDQNGRPDVHKTCTRPYQLAGRPSGRPTEVNPLSGCPGRPGGRPVREPLLSGSGRGRLAGSTVYFLTVGRSTGRSTGRPIWALSAANGNILFGPLYTPSLGCFGQDFQRAKIYFISSVLLQVSKEFQSFKDLIFILF